MFQRSIDLLGFERETTFEFPRSTDLGPAPAALIHFTSDCLRGMYEFDAGLPLRRFHDDGTPSEYPDEVVLSAETIEALKESQTILDDEIPYKLTDKMKIELQRSKLEPGYRALWKEADNWHVDITHIDMTHSPVLTLPIGVGTQEIHGSADIEDVFYSLSWNGRYKVRSVVEARRKLQSPERVWAANQKATTASLIIAQYSDENDDQLPDGLQIHELSAGHRLLIPSLAVVHRSSRNRTEDPVMKSHLHLWPRETLRSQRSRLSYLRAS